MLRACEEGREKNALNARLINWVLEVKAHFGKEALFIYTQTTRLAMRVRRVGRLPLDLTMSCALDKPHMLSQAWDAAPIGRAYNGWRLLNVRFSFVCSTWQAPGFPTWPECAFFAKRFALSHICICQNVRFASIVFPPKQCALPECAHLLMCAQRSLAMLCRVSTGTQETLSCTDSCQVLIIERCRHRAKTLLFLLQSAQVQNFASLPLGRHFLQAVFELIAKGLNIAKMAWSSQLFLGILGVIVNVPAAVLACWRLCRRTQPVSSYKIVAVGNIQIAFLLTHSPRNTS